MKFIPEHVTLDSSSLLPQSFVPSHSHLLGMQRLLLHLNCSMGQLWLSIDRTDAHIALYSLYLSYIASAKVSSFDWCCIDHHWIIHGRYSLIYSHIFSQNMKGCYGWITNTHNNKHIIILNNCSLFPVQTNVLTGKIFIHFRQQAPFSPSQCLQ